MHFIGQLLQLRSTALTLHFVVILIYGQFLVVLMLIFTCTRTNKQPKKRKQRSRRLSKKVKTEQVDDDGVWEYDNKQTTDEFKSTDGTNTTTPNERLKMLARRLLHNEKKKRLADKKRRKQKKRKERQEALERGEKPESASSMSFLSEQQQSAVQPIVDTPVPKTVPQQEVKAVTPVPKAEKKLLTAPTQDVNTKSEKSKKSRRVLPNKKVSTPKKSMDPTQKTTTIAEERTTQDATKTSNKQKQRTKEKTGEKSTPTKTPSAESQTVDGRILSKRNKKTSAESDARTSSKHNKKMSAENDARASSKRNKKTSAENDARASPKRKKKMSAESVAKTSVDASKKSERPKTEDLVQIDGALTPQTLITTQSPHGKDTKSDPKTNDPFATKTPTTTQSPPPVKEETEVKPPQLNVSKRHNKSQSSGSSQNQSNQ